MPGNGYTTVTVPKELVEKIKLMVNSPASDHYGETISGYIVRVATQELDRERSKVIVITVPRHVQPQQEKFVY